MNRRFFIKSAAASMLVSVGGATAFVYGVNTYDLETTRVHLSLGLGKPLRLLAMGDFHYDPKREAEYLDLVCSRITESKADLVVLTGDYITNFQPPVYDLAARLSRAHSNLGFAGVLGNHDQWAGSDLITNALRKRDIRVLRNESYALPGYDNWYLTGLDSFWAGKPDAFVFDRTPPDSRHILLVHEPDPFPQLNDPRIKLQISGHTHGGQVRLPLVGALRLPKWGKNYQEGLFTEDGRHLYVNRGIGTLGPHLRYNCRPEMTLFELT